MNLVPLKINMKAGSGCIEFAYQDGLKEELSYEFLRVHSPSAEVRGHGEGSEVLQFGKKRVVVDNIEAVGNYAIKLVFSDGHDSGIYTWQTIRTYCESRDAMWSSYLDKLAQTGQSRDP